MCKRTQLLVLLACLAGIARVQVVRAKAKSQGPDNSVVFCCARVRNGRIGTDCDAELSGTASNAEADNTTPNGPIADCTHAYQTGAGLADPFRAAGVTTGGHINGYYCPGEGGQCMEDQASSGHDPHIVGLDGRHYILWGKLNTTYNLLSERNHAINIHLFHPENVADKQALYIDAAGFLIHSARLTVRMIRPTPKDQSRLVLTLGSDTTEITFPGRPVDRAIDSLTSYSFRSPQKVTISSRDLVVSVYIADDYYLNVLIDEVAASWGDVHGVMGQTHASAFKLRYNYARGTAVGDMPADIYKLQRHRPYEIKGKEDDYIVSGLLKTDDKFSRFVPQPIPVSRKLFNNKAASAVIAQKNEARARTVAAVLGA